MAYSPESADIAVLLHQALVDLVRAAGTRRALPRLLHIGTPGAEEVVLAEEASLDPGLRADLVERALDGLSLETVPLSWITRIGELAPGDADFAWLAAAREGYGRHDLELSSFYVMTRYGWMNLLNDQVVRWSRIRPAKRR